MIEMFKIGYDCYDPKVTKNTLSQTTETHGQTIAKNIFEEGLSRITET